MYVLYAEHFIRVIKYSFKIPGMSPATKYLDIVLEISYTNLYLIKTLHRQLRLPDQRNSFIATLCEISPKRPRWPATSLDIYIRQTHGRTNGRTDGHTDRLYEQKSIHSISAWQLKFCFSIKIWNNYTQSWCPVWLIWQLLGLRKTYRSSNIYQGRKACFLS